jgi:cytochrome c peroxidase
MFWDVRVRSLELQALEPLKAVDEMRGGAYPEDQALAAAVSRLNGISEYRKLFARAYGGTTPVSERNVGRALAAFQRTLVAVNTPFDRYMRGEATALTAEQVSGMERFQSIGCINCHSGPMFSDFATHVLAVPDSLKLLESDSGVNSTYAFRTPSLRNLGVTAPYMHSGVFKSLPEVIGFYQRVSRGGGRGRDGGGRFGGGGGDDGRRGDGRFGDGGGGAGRAGDGRGRGGGRGGNPLVSPGQIDPLVRQLDMRGGGQRDLIAFLHALDDPDFDRTVPVRVPSGLPVGGAIQR